MDGVRPLRLGHRVAGLPRALGGIRAVSSFERFRFYFA